MSYLCRRLFPVTVLLIALLSGCAPSYERRPWTLVYQSGDDLRLPTRIGDGGPFFYRGLQPQGAAPSPRGTHLLMATEAGELWLYQVIARRGQFTRLAEKGVVAQFWQHVSPWAEDGKAFVYVRDGNLIYQRLGRSPRLIASTGDVFTASISTDGLLVTFGRRDALQEDLGLWVASVQGGDARQIVPPTGDIFHACCPHWSPDGQRIAFLQAYEGGALGVVSADGSNLRVGIEAAWEPVRWLPDSSSVLFTKTIYGEPSDGIYRYDVSSDRASLLAAGGRQATYALDADGARALVASWSETADGKVSDARLEILNLQTGAIEGQPVALAGAVEASTWAPDSRQIALLIRDAQGTGWVWHSPNGLEKLQRFTVASSLAGWVRLWQPPNRPSWWPFNW